MLWPADRLTSFASFVKVVIGLLHKLCTFLFFLLPMIIIMIITIFVTITLFIMITNMMLMMLMIV